LAADFARLGEQVAEAEKAGADRIHVDVMDGHFMPNLSMGAPGVQSLRRVTSLPLETHVMITHPDLFLEEFVAAGSDSFLAHWGELQLGSHSAADQGARKTRRVVINPATPASVLSEIVPEVDLVLVMTVNPGFGRQQFLHSMLTKIQRVRRMVDEVNPRCEVEVDGAVDEETAPLGRSSGSKCFVAGSSIFGDKAGVTTAMDDFGQVKLGIEQHGRGPDRQHEAARLGHTGSCGSKRRNSCQRV
jgi:ribulose-phosphate 3-epimerase